MVAVAHPGAFVAALSPAQRRPGWQQATARLVAGEARRLDAMCGGDPLFKKAEQRRFATATSRDTKADETAMLVDPAARLGDDGVYARGRSEVNEVDRQSSSERSAETPDALTTPSASASTWSASPPSPSSSTSPAPGSRARSPPVSAARPGPASGGEAESLAARWAAKEAVIKAWSSTCFGHPEVIDPEYVDLREIEVRTDAWGRPAIRLHGEIADSMADYTCSSRSPTTPRPTSRRRSSCSRRTRGT